MPAPATEYCPVYAPFFGILGATCAIVFCCMGAAYGTAKAGVGLTSMGVLRPDLIIKGVVPIIMAGIIGIYGLVVSVLIGNGFEQRMSLFAGFIQLGAGLSVGLSGMAAGFAVGIVGDAGVRASAQQPRLYTGMILVLIFAEVLALYGLIVALILNARVKSDC
ncbi:H(+)-transporting V0 sector ATPase subunit c [Actinomortierella ambigua]|uniref:V-type proton ATPase proteolipid subunit n=1 Tax=Actinomortierella ambigua TaxID=1343610 RepID=A0A9P6PZJ5_9FUNG|nr:H(+)-transporting V0 sector ATPase subunit c [Actinomortierella ambigua]KAG0256040.1 H(+)-transporting V0 sector ATPase subunit c [Actinomortierella ambigua]